MSDLCRAPVEAPRRRKIPPSEADRNRLLSLAPTVPDVPRPQVELYSFRWVRRLRPVDDGPNLLASTLAGLSPAAPFVQFADYYTAPRRPRRTADDSIDWLLIEVVPPPIFPQDFTGLARERVAHADDAPNLLLTTLSGPIAPSPFVQTFEYSYSLPRRLCRSIEIERDWLLAAAPTVPAVPPVAPDQPYSRAARAQRFDLWPNLLLTTFSIAPQAAWYQSFDLPPARRAITQRFDDYQNLALTIFGLTSQSPFATSEAYAPRRPRIGRSDEISNLLLTTLTPAPLSNVEMLTPIARRRLGRIDETSNLLIGTFSIVPQAVLPFASGEWPVPRVRRPYAIEASLNLTLTTLAHPAVSISFDVPSKRHIRVEGPTRTKRVD